MATRGSANRHIVGPRFKGEPQFAAQLNTLSRRLDDTIRQAFTADLTRDKKRGGGGLKMKWARIAGTNGSGAHNIPNTSLKCRDLDSAQNPTGPEFDVFILSRGDTAGQLGMVPVANIWPPLRISDNVLAVYLKDVPHGTAGRVTGWFAFGFYGRTGCG